MIINCLTSRKTSNQTANTQDINARGLQTYQPANSSSFRLKLSQMRPVKVCTEADLQCIAYSGMILEPLLTHDPLQLRFRLYFKHAGHLVLIITTSQSPE